MSFVTFETGAWDDPWVAGLPPMQKYFWFYLCTCQESFDNYGVIEPRPALWLFRTGLERGSMDEALARFIADGKIIDDNGMLWIVNYIHYRRLKGLNLRGALDQIKARLDTKPGLLTRILSKYDPETTGLERGSNGVLQSESESESHRTETEQITNQSVEAAVRPSIERPIPPDATSRERTMLSEVKDCPGWKLDYPGDLAYIRALSIEYPQIDILDVVRTMRAWLADRPKEKASRLRLRNFCKNAVKYKRGATGSTPPSKDVDWQDGVF